MYRACAAHVAGTHHACADRWRPGPAFSFTKTTLRCPKLPLSNRSRRPPHRVPARPARACCWPSGRAAGRRGRRRGLLVVGAARQAAGAAPAPAAAPAYLPLDPLVVNLSDDGSAAHLLRIAITLKLAGPDAKEALTARMPEIRDRVLNTLASQHADRIVSAEGKAALREALLAQVAAVARAAAPTGRSARCCSRNSWCSDGRSRGPAGRGQRRPVQRPRRPRMALSLPRNRRAA